MEQIATIVTAVFGSQVLATAITSWFGRKKTNADAATAVVDATLKWASGLTARIEALEKAAAEKDVLIAELRQKVAILEAEVEGEHSHKDK